MSYTDRQKCTREKGLDSTTYNYIFERGGQITHSELHTHNACIALVKGNASNLLSSQYSHLTYRPQPMHFSHGEKIDELCMREYLDK